MNILIVGCGKVGARLANVLSKEGHDVSVVDADETKFEYLDSDFSGFTTTGIPIDEDVLKKAGIQNCDAVVALSENDNVNIMVCQLAREIFGIENSLARIYDSSREDVFSHFGIDTVCPTNLTVDAVRSAVIEGHKPKVMHLGCHTVSFVTVQSPKNIIGNSARDLEFDDNQVLFGIEHSDGAMTLYNGQNIRIQPGDKLIVSYVVD